MRFWRSSYSRFSRRSFLPTRRIERTPPVKTVRKKVWWSSSSGRIELLIPLDAVDACSHPGPCDSDVDHWVDHIHWRGVERSTMEQELKEVGAWNDLTSAPIRTLKERLLWIACNDLKEDGH